MEDRVEATTHDDASGELTVEVRLGRLSDDSQERLFSLAAFPAGAVVSYWLLGRLWGVGERRSRREGDRLAERSLAVVARGNAGLRLDDATRTTVRRLAPDRPAAVSARVLDILRPSGGWHELPADQRPFLNTLCFHLRQAGRSTELAESLRDMRLLVIRLAAFGPAAIEADLEAYGDPAARELAELLRQEGRLLTGGLSAQDIELTLESRLAARPSLPAWLNHIEEARPARGLLTTHAPPDRDDPALLRSLTVPVRPEPTGPFEVTWHIIGGYDIDWHPSGDRLAVVNGGPTLQLIAADNGTRTGVVEVPDARMERVLCSPDGTRFAVLDKSYRRPAPKWNISDEPYGGAVLSICDPLTGTETDALTTSAAAAPAFCWAPDSASLAVTGTTGLWLWRPGAGTPPTALPNETMIQKWGDIQLPAIDHSRDHDLGLVDDDDLDWRPPLLDQVADWHPEHGLLAHARGSLLHWTDPEGPEPPDIWPVPQGEQAVYVRWRPDGRTAALATKHATLIVDPVARQVRWRWSYGTGADGLRWAPDGERLAVCDGALVRLWHIPDDSELERGAAPAVTSVIRLGPEHSPRGVLAWRPDGAAIAATETRHTIRLWRSDAPTGQAADDPRQPLALTHVMWNQDGTELAVRAEDSRWFHVDPAKPHAGMRTSAPHPYTRRDPAERGRWLDEAGVPYYREPPIFEETPLVPDIVEFAPDEQTHAWIDHLKRLRVINPDGHHLIELNLLPMSRGAQIKVCFTPDGTHVVVAGRGDPRTSHVIAAWRLTQPTQESPAAEWRQLDQPANSVPDIGFIRRITASQTHVAMIAYPGLIGLFALADMRHLCWIRTNAPIEDAAFDPTGHRLAVVGAAGLYLFAVHDPGAGIATPT